MGRLEAASGEAEAGTREAQGWGEDSTVAPPAAPLPPLRSSSGRGPASGSVLTSAL